MFCCNFAFVGGILAMQVVTLQKKILVELCVADVLHYLYTNDK